MKRRAVLGALLGAPAVQAFPLLDAFHQLVYPEAGSPPAMTPAQQQLLENPSALLAQLEKRFYDAPAIESLAWYGTVAEDLAYVGMMRRTDPATGRVAPAPGGTAWLKQARAAWRRMIAHLERGWSPGAPWPRFGSLRYKAVNFSSARRSFWEWRDDALAQRASQWFPRPAPSFFKTDRDAYFVGGEPLTQRVRLRGASAGRVEFGAELSDAALTEPAPRSEAGGFRRAHAFVEFLKGHPQPPVLKFAHESQYGHEGLLGTVEVAVAAPPSLPVAAVTREGLVPATRLGLTARFVRCGADNAVRIGFATPPKSAPLAYLATLSPLDPAKVRVQRVGVATARDPAQPSDAPFRYTAFRVDLDADGHADLVIVQGRGPVELPTSGIYDDTGDELQCLVYANIAGQWKQVALAWESGCT